MRRRFRRAATAARHALGDAGPASVVGGSQASYQATEFNVNGNAVSSANVRFSLDSTALGTIDPTSGVLSASTANNAGGHIIATDTTNAVITGALAITVLSARPATAGDSLSYAGTFTTSTANNVISKSGPVVMTQSATVAQVVVVAGDVWDKPCSTRTRPIRLRYQR